MCSSNIIEKGKQPSAPKYRDEPRYKVISEYEDQFKSNYRSMLGSMVAEITSKMSSFIK